VSHSPNPKPKNDFVSQVSHLVYIYTSFSS
jgi:hypothetical protein